MPSRLNRRQLNFALYAMKGCKDLAKLIEFSCCISCHEDEYEWGYYMFDLEFNGIEYHTCCGGYRAIETYNKANTPDPRKPAGG